MPAVGYHYPRGARDIMGSCQGKTREVTEPRDCIRFRVICERDYVIFCSHDQQRRRSDLVIFVPDRLLIDHLEGECRGTCLPRIVGTQGDAN
jgi:hypothetical protein